MRVFGEPPETGDGEIITALTKLFLEVSLDRVNRVDYVVSACLSLVTYLILGLQPGDESRHIVVDTLLDIIARIQSGEHNKVKEYEVVDNEQN